jgi:NADPH-dependent 2,4-dienoyl-CoA reductase/sulfur reductase-like enzyme
MAHPNTKITIVHADRLPVSDLFPESFRKRAIASLKEHGIDIVLGEKVDLSSIGKKGPVRLSSGKVLEADLVV